MEHGDHDKHGEHGEHGKHGHMKRDAHGHDHGAMDHHPGNDMEPSMIMRHMAHEMMEGVKMPLIMPPVLSNITCIMQHMKWMDAHYQPHVTGMQKVIKGLNLNPFLTMSMTNDIDHCAKETSCLMDKDSPFGPKVSRMMNFLRCVGYKFFKCCVINEMMLKLPMGPMSPEPLDDATKLQHMATHMAEASNKDPMEMMKENAKEGAFMMIMQTMFGPQSPFMM